MILSKNNILYYDYKNNIRFIVKEYFSNFSPKVKSLEEAINKINEYFYIYNDFNKYGITTNKLGNSEDILYCDKTYNEFESKFASLILSILNSYNPEKFINTKYYQLLKNYQKSIISTDKMAKIYYEFSKFTNKQEFPFSKILDYLNERQSTLKNTEYISYSNYIKKKIGINSDFIDTIIKNNIVPLKIVTISEEQIEYNLSTAKNIIYEILKDYYDINILTKLLDSIYISTTRSGTVVAYGEIPIINIYSDNKSVDIIVLAHELGHAYHYYCNEENEIENFGSRSDFSEAFAIATQLIVADSLGLKNTIIRDYNNFYCDTLYSLKIALYIEEHQKELTETMLKEKFEDYKNYFRFILENFYDYYYFIGFIAGNILSKKIVANKYSKETLKQKLAFNSNSSLIEIFKLFDINIANEKDLIKYIQFINEYYQNLVRN